MTVISFPVTCPACGHDTTVDQANTDGRQSVITLNCPDCGGRQALHITLRTLTRPKYNVDPSRRRPRYSATGADNYEQWLTPKAAS